ncbi:MAG: hypothetical protein PHS49_04410 [Candidatus Gracilibacteria bacterium]|nr:hypothetical protein [Candidatus Gracilibacteria bacterium]
MKYFLLILSSFILIFSFSTINYSSANTVFDNSTNQPPYCKPGDVCGIPGGVKQVKDVKVIVTDRPASQYIQDVAIYLLRFLALTATLIIIYAGFVMLTSLGNEEKVTKSKKMIIYAVIGLVIIYGAGPFSDFVFGVLNA